jgi:hypothetical protein
MGWLVLGLRPAGARGVRSDSKEVWEHRPKSECPSRATLVTEVRPKRRYARMKVLIGVDPHKGSVAVAALDEASGELVERAAFSQDRAGLRSLQRAGRNGSPNVVGRWRTPAASVGTWR